MVDRPSRRFVVVAALVSALLAAAACSRATSHPPELGWKGPSSGVFAAWKETFPAGQVLEFRDGRFRYRQDCDPDPAEKPVLPFPVEGEATFQDGLVVLKGPSGWQLERRMAHVHGVDMLVRPDEFESWAATGSMPIFGIAARVEGASFEDVDSRRLSRNVLEGRKPGG